MRDVADSEYVSDPRFIRAVRDGNADEVIALLAAGVNVDGVSRANGGTALTFACMDGHVDVVTVQRRMWT
jgi:ankyrin repeat protein